MVRPERAAVRPRIVAPASGAVLPLAEEVERLLREHDRGAVRLVGGCGAGKTTALAHLAAVLPADLPVTLLDGAATAEVIQAAAAGVVVYTSLTVPPILDLVSLSLAPWGDDELIEYLLARHKDRCKSVMARLRPQDRQLLGGVPDLWQLVLERLACDGSARNGHEALCRHLEALLPDTDLLERARSACLNALTAGGERWPRVLEQLAGLAQVEGVVRVLRHPAAQALLAADRIAADLDGEADCDFLAVRLPRDLVSAAAAALDDSPRAHEHLRRLLAGPPPWSHAMAASLLHATSRGWRPERGGVWGLEGAYLEGVVWPGVDLAGARLSKADLTGADLRGADLRGAVARGARLGHALLAGARLQNFDATGADLRHADLSRVEAPRARLGEADLEGACLEGASLPDASLAGAVLTGANLTGADLSRAKFDGARLAGSDFTGANLKEAHLAGLHLCEGCFAGANFEGAGLDGCDLEYMELPAANFRNAQLSGALLTGSRMPGADFEGACLAGARLAEVEWEGACLRDADLRGASFHMGSSRSGLVFSPIASEGTRTGFYTDDYEEQHYKSPEEVRKANLCGVDLRGAHLDGTDFYLVDLRGAQYSPSDAEHLRRCGAILGVRT